MKKILQPVISRDDTETIFQNFAQKKVLKIFPAPKLKSVRLEMIYMPFFIFEITLEEKDRLHQVLFSADGIQGNVAPFSPESEVYTYETDCQTYDFVISKDVAEKRVTEFSRGLVLEHGLKFNRNTSVKQIAFKQNIYFPFWIIYFQKKGRYDFKAIDAISGELTPITMRQVFLNVFRQ